MSDHARAGRPADAGVGVTRFARLGRVAPVLAPPPWSALLRGAAAGLGLPALGQGLDAEARRLFPRAAGVACFESGRAALAAALEVAMRFTGRRTVLLPAFTSYSVAAAAAVVGARVRLCDVNPDTLDVDPDVLRAALDTDVGAVVLGNLFGWPSVTPTALARSVGALVIDDAAQALGARERNLLVGERGDLAILSLGRGKCLTVGDAGVLLVHRAELTDLAREFRPAGRAGSLKPWVTALAVRAASWPWVFGVGTRAGIGNVGESTYTPAFGRRRVARSAEGLAARLGERAQWLAAERARVAEQWRNALQHAPVSFPVVRTGTAPAYLRFPVLVQDPLTREVIVERLSRVGLSHVLSYPTPLNGIAPFRVACCEDGPPTPGAAALASRLLALPCHRGVTPSVMRRATAMVTAVAPAERIQGRHDAESAADSAAGT